MREREREREREQKQENIVILYYYIPVFSIFVRFVCVNVLPIVIESLLTHPNNYELLR